MSLNQTKSKNFYRLSKQMNGSFSFSLTYLQRNQSVLIRRLALVQEDFSIWSLKTSICFGVWLSIITLLELYAVYNVIFHTYDQGMKWKLIEWCRQNLACGMISYSELSSLMSTVCCLHCKNLFIDILPNIHTFTIKIRRQNLLNVTHNTRSWRHTWIERESNSC